MRVIMDLCVVPMGVGFRSRPMSPPARRCWPRPASSSASTPTAPISRGEWDEVMAAVRRCHERVHAMGVPRITTTIKLGTRTDRDQGMDDKVESVRRKLQRHDG